MQEYHQVMLNATVQKLKIKYSQYTDLLKDTVKYQIFNANKQSGLEIELFETKHIIWGLRFLYYEYVAFCNILLQIVFVLYRSLRQFEDDANVK